MLIVDWFIQLTTAIMYIHERRILHRDLKTRNIFLKNNLIKLGDFGISRILMGTSDLASTFAGTPHFMSPEALKQNGYNSKSDIWSLGVVLYELCTLRRAFPGSNIMAVMYRIVEGERPELPATVSSDLRRVFSKMLEKDPRKRPSAVAILQESFLQERMESLRGKLANQVALAVPPSSPPSSSPSFPLREAEAIAKALKPVKKKNLQATSDSPPLTPRY
jgi:NIMA (never in mitosis gene a)-related kinase